MHDVKATVRWARANAKRYNLDPDRIGVWGASAGAHLANLMATTGDVPEFEGSAGGEALSGHSSAVRCCCDMFGPTHLARLSGVPGDSTKANGTTAWIIEALLGGPVAEKRKLADMGSPELHVSASTAPHFIVHGDHDNVVALEQSTTYHAKLQAAGVESTLTIIPGGGHGTGWGTQGDADQTEAWAKGDTDYVNPVINERLGAFFDQHLKA